ncbi:PulJ/GspJ family protein [Demequina iriomotensis]|uniref:PulJ/GspJ family protein n=1 Tax=Demequina iriomotensis TaxID=1536641 RepID=UPI0007825075|nr:type II secretion system protein [Demequina iriomotensis]
MAPVTSLITRLRERADRDSGMTIVELVVSMSIFTIVITIFMGALISMAHTTSEAQRRVDAANSLRASFSAMDRQVRYASSINRPVRGPSGDWYVEFELTDLPAGQAPLCYQWRLDDDAETVAYRTWRRDGTSSASNWVTIAWNVARVGSGSPFTFASADDSRMRQSLTLELAATQTEPSAAVDLSTTFVARNSSTASTTNADANSDGVSDNQVCIAGLGRP